MATRKRTTRRSSSLVGRAVSAGRRALREAESRIPPDLRRQLDRRLKDADKTARAAIKQLQAQVKKATTRADVNTVLRRIDALTKQARQVAQGRTPRGAATPRRRAAATTTRRAPTRTRKAASTSRRARPAAAAAAAAPARRAAPTRRAAPRRRTQPPEVEMAEISETIIPVEEGEIDVIEVSES